MAERAIPASKWMVWHGIVAPLGTPPALVKRLNEEFVKAAQSPDVVQKAAAQGVEMITSSPEDFGKLIAMMSSGSARPCATPASRCNSEQGEDDDRQRAEP